MIFCSLSLICKSEFLTYFQPLWGLSMFQKQIFLTSSRFGALQNFFRSCIFSSALLLSKKNMTKTVLTWRILLLLPFCILMASVNNHRKCYDIYLPLRCHKHFGLLVSHLCPIFGSVIVNLVTIAIGQATGRLQNIAIFQ